MSLWQFMAQVEGYADANTPEDQKVAALSDTEIDDISSMMRNG